MLRYHAEKEKGYQRRDSSGCQQCEGKSCWQEEGPRRHQVRSLLMVLTHRVDIADKQHKETDGQVSLWPRPQLAIESLCITADVKGES